MKYDNCVIKNLNEDFGKKLIQWWKDQGINTNDNTGYNTEENHERHYYGLHNGSFDSFSLDKVNRLNLKVIELPSIVFIPVISETELKTQGFEKHKYNNCVIKNINRDFGKKIIQWWKDQGVNTGSADGSCIYLFDSYYYYGLYNGEFNVFNLNQINKYNLKVIELPIENTIENTIKIGNEIIDLSLPFPRMMEVWDWKGSFYEENVCGILPTRDNYPVITNNNVFTYCREIVKPVLKKMSIEEIEKELGYKIDRDYLLK